MTDTATAPASASSAGDGLADETVALVRRWLREAADVPVDASAAQLAGLLEDPDGLAFAVGFVDGVVRPEDPRVGARTLAALAPRVPAFLPAHLRAAVRLGGLLAPRAPWLVVPLARRALRRMVSHLVVDATDASLGRSISALRSAGAQLNINLLGEAVLGQAEAARRVEGTARLLARDDVDYVSIKVSSTVAPHAPWAFEEAVSDVAEHLAPLLRQAAATTPPTFVNLDMEEYRDLDLTVEVFTRLLDRPELEQYEAGIVLQAYLPDALAAMQRLQAWAAARRARGGAGIKVRLVKGANLPMERVEADVHGWPLATWGSKAETDTNYKRVLDWALTPERTRNVRLGLAGHNLFDVAHAWLLAGRRGVRAAVDVEMLLGMATGQAEVVRREVGGLLLYTPVVHPGEFDVAIAYLVRRLEEGASSENFMSAVFALDADEGLFAREEARFRASLAALDAAPGLVPPPHRTADRFAATPRPRVGAFTNTPDSDPSVPEQRAWVREVLDRVPTSRLGADGVEAARVTDEAGLDRLLERVAAAGAAWGARTGAQRGAVLHRAGELLEAARAELVEVMAAEAGKTVDQADPEVSEAVDFAHYYGELAAELDAVDGAVAVPARLTLVTPPWNFPVAITAGGALAALAAGSAVVLKPSPLTERCAAVLGAAIGAALAEAGADPDTLRLAVVEESALGRQLVTSPLVERAVLTGAYETAQLFRSFRPDLPLLAETSGKNALVVTPSADLDLAVKDLVASAFGHAGQKCSAASLVVLVGSVARSRRFATQLRDAVSSLVVGLPEQARTQMGPLIAPASGKLQQGLTTLGPGERWLLEPRQLDEAGRSWTPGVREGVARGSAFHRTELFGPVLGVMTAATLQEAIAIVDEVDYGLTSGLHSRDAGEIATWLDQVAAGNLYVNRGTTGAVVRRQPFGGWKRSAVGPGSKAGGPHYLLGLTGWASRASSCAAPVSSAGVRGLLSAAAAALAAEDAAALERAARSDAAAWAEVFSRADDVSALVAERNVLRYRPTPVVVRLAACAALVDALRVVAAGALTGAPVHLSVPAALPGALAGAVAGLVDEVVVEDDAAWLARATALAERRELARVRLVATPVSGAAGDLAAALAPHPDVAVWSGPVTEAGRLELLPFLREQAVSMTAHRFGSPDGLVDEVLPLAPR